MYQVLIRILGPQLAVFDFAYGRIVDGSFRIEDTRELPDDVVDHVQISELLGTQSFVKIDQLGLVTSALLKRGAEMAFYPNFLTFTLPEDYVSKKEENAQ